MGVFFIYIYLMSKKYLVRGPYNRSYPAELRNNKTGVSAESDIVSWAVDKLLQIISDDLPL